MYVCRICKHGPAHGRSHNPSGGSANSSSPIQTSSGGIKDEDMSWNENSFGESSDKDLVGDGDSRGAMHGMGRGKPMSAMSHGGTPGFPGKRKRFGMVGRPPGSISGSGGGMSAGPGRGSGFSGASPNSALKPGALSGKNSSPYGQPSTTAAAAIASKKRGEDRKRGRPQSGVAKIRGMVALQVY